VGGDFFQILPSTSGGLLAVIGDVSGEGMPAAMTVSLLVGTVRMLAHYTDSPGSMECIASGPIPVTVRRPSAIGLSWLGISLTRQDSV